jgi:hypothetical protein
MRTRKWCGAALPRVHAVEEQAQTCLEKSLNDVAETRTLKNAPALSCP